MRKPIKRYHIFAGTGFLLLIGFGLLQTGLVSQSNRVSRESLKQEPTKVPNDWMGMQRMYPHDRINPEAFLDAANQAKTLMESTSARNTPWTFAGPTNIGGRITDVEIPNGDLQTIYVGGSTGGILKTTNGGETWTNLFTNVPVISIGDLAIDPANSDIIYAGTGEANSSSFSFWGNGMYKSTDAGLTWNHIGLEQSAYIGRIIVDHSNSQRIYVAACGYLFSTNDERGVYRSTDGGLSWEQVLYLTDSTAAIDLVQHPGNPQILYATMWQRVRGLEYRNSFGATSGIWKTTNGGDTWTELTNGLPANLDAGRIGITLCQSDPEVLYAFYDLPNFEVGVFKTINGGQTWVRTNDTDLYGMNSNFGWYFGQIKVDPSNPDRVYVMGVSLFMTVNGGNSWIDLSGGNIHVDHHAMYIDPANGIIVEGNDGGLYTSDDQGYSWDKINNLPLTQFYAIDIDYQLPYRIYGGTQDNNTIRTLTGNVDDWEAILGGDGMYCLVDYTNSDVIYAEYQWGNLFRSDNGGYDMQYIASDWEGERVNWSAPLAMHPDNPSILYFGTYRIWKTFNKGNSWTPFSDDLTKGIDQYFHTITTIAISPVNPSIVVAGTGDGKVHVSQNDGLIWTDITAGLPDRWITRVTPDPFDAQTIYATISGFRWDEPLPHVYKTTNLGQSWTSITGNLPEFPVNDIVIDPDVPDHMIVATDAGVYGSVNGGQVWDWIWTELPAVPVYVLKIHAPTRKIVAGTYGLSMYSANLDELWVGLQPAQSQLKVGMDIFPNPVLTKASVSFYLPEKQDITLNLTGMNGKIINQVYSGLLSKGKHTIPEVISTENFPAGTYLLTLCGSTVTGTTKVVVIR